MGALLGIGIRAPCYAGHYFVWGQLDFGVCDASRAAHSRARVETGVSRAGRISGRDFGGRVPVVAARIGGGARRGGGGGGGGWGCGWFVGDFGGGSCWVC